MSNNLGQFQNNIPALPSLDVERYENIFKIYEVEKTSANFYYYYNISKKIEIPESLDKTIIGTLSLDRNLPWTTLSYKLYGTQFLWWLIFLLNKPENIFYAEAGSEIKYVISDYINIVLQSISQQISK